MKRTRHEFFAGARLSQNADASFTGGDFLHLCHHATHGVALPDDFVLAEAVLKIAILAFQSSKLQGILDRQQELFRGDWLFEKIECAQSCGSYGHVDVRLPRHHYDRCGYGVRLQFFEQRKAIFSGHDDVREDQIEGLRLGQFQRADGVIANGGLVSFETECSRQ